MASSKPRAAIVHGQPVGPEKLQFVQLLRRSMTRPERLLWNALRGSQLNGLHFRRQQIAGDFVLDMGIAVVRIANDNLMKDPDAVAGWIAQQAAQRVLAERRTT